MLSLGSESDKALEIINIIEWCDSSIPEEIRGSNFHVKILLAFI